ncbi:Crp/Fnr family transcriptional regulator [Pedobacter sp. G11]|uniref:Crp/Fnr family transcriptional regulator n=1 Tax=Pedobacter sp. G11 TaxID=2482728 RepID=UPI000F6003D9|nr:cyclic nucleotide-binding domain-containing protein [Pedobacter sp. G11]AZI24151.1 Crp/Fnr family transcriptional regulator [Pedobacter sp. G11]
MVPDPNFQAIVERINGFTTVSQPFLDALKPLLKIHHFPYTEHLLRTGRKARYAYFILKGYVREITPSSAVEQGHTTWFWFPGDFILAYPVFFNQKDALSDIEALPDTVLLEISHEDFMMLRIKFREVEKLVEEIEFYYDKARIAHSEDLFNLSGRQKYRKFYSAHPALFNVAKHKDIASFLGLKDIGFRRYYSLFA